MGPVLEQIAVSRSILIVCSDSDDLKPVDGSLEMEHIQEMLALTQTLTSIYIYIYRRLSVCSIRERFLR